MFRIACCLLACLHPTSDHPENRTTSATRVIAGVATLRCDGNPAGLIVTDNARPLVVSPRGHVFAAADALGRGRVVVLGHGSFVRDEHPDSVRFTANAIEWLAPDPPGGATADPLRIAGAPPAVVAALEQRDRTVRTVALDAAETDLTQLDVLVASPQAFEAAGRLADLERWIRAGGGVLITETAWGVLQLNPDLTLDTLAAQHLLHATGIRFTAAAHHGYGDNGTYPIDPNLLDAGNAQRALEILAGTHDGDAALAARVVGDALRDAPLASPLVRAAQELARARRADCDALYRSMREQRLTSAEQPLALALLDLDARLADELPPEQLRAHPSAAAFPGPVDEPPQRTRVVLDADIPGWRSTGLYARPGELVTVRVDDELADAGIELQVGAWLDPHDHAYRVRMRTALRRFPLDARAVRLASAIGGPIYIDLPPDYCAAHAGRALAFDIDGAAPAPHYRLGVTDLAAWRDTIRNRRAPWAEFESDQLAFTVPASAVRDVERPDLVMQHWDRVHAAMQSLEPRTANHWADRQYRYVADASISWGYMYCPSDAPIVIPLDEAAEMFRVENFDADGPNELWGHYHEMGHAHQNPRWTDRATSEVTVNIFTVYALHIVNGYPLDHEAMRSQYDHAYETFRGHAGTERPFEEVGGPFPRLQFYALLWHNFGFDAFRETFKRLRDLPPDEQPRDDVAERNLFIAHFSETVGRNLVPYGEAWGLEVTDATRTRLAGLEPWRPTAR